MRPPPSPSSLVYSAVLKGTAAPEQGKPLPGSVFRTVRYSGRHDCPLPGQRDWKPFSWVRSRTV